MATSTIASSLLLILIFIISVCPGTLKQVYAEEEESNRDLIARMPCMLKLMHCRPLAYKEKDKVPEECCTPLEHVLVDEKQCFCSIFAHERMLRVMNMTTEELYNLPTQCSLDGPDDAECQKCLNEGPSSSGVAISSPNYMLVIMLLMAAALQLALIQNC